MGKWMTEHYKEKIRKAIFLGRQAQREYATTESDAEAVKVLEKALGNILEVLEV